MSVRQGVGEAGCRRESATTYSTYTLQIVQNVLKNNDNLIQILMIERSLHMRTKSYTLEKRNSFTGTIPGTFMTAVELGTR